MPVRDVLIVGAGPSGLATAIAAKQQGLDYVIVEKGVLVNSIFNFPMHMVFFTTPELLEIGGLPLVDAVRQADAARGAALLPPRRGHLRTSRSRFTRKSSRSNASDDGVFAVTTHAIAA